MYFFININQYHLFVYRKVFLSSGLFSIIQRWRLERKISSWVCELGKYSGFLYTFLQFRVTIYYCLLFLLIIAS